MMQDFVTFALIALGQSAPAAQSLAANWSQQVATHWETRQEGLYYRDLQGNEYEEASS